MFVFFSFLRHFPIFSPMLLIFSFSDPRRYFATANVGNTDSYNCGLFLTGMERLNPESKNNVTTTQKTKDCQAHKSLQVASFNNTSNKA
jgi:hypothetical protein